MRLVVGEVATVGWSTINGVLDEVTSQVSIANIVAVVGGALAIAATFFFLWWGIRKGLRIIKNAAAKGKIKA